MNREGMDVMQTDSGNTEPSFRCAIEVTLHLISGKWKALIICHLLTGVMRYSDLKRIFPEMTPKMLTQQLRELERDGLVTRTVYAQVPPKVEYSLTQLGQSLEPVIRLLSDWGVQCSARGGTPVRCCGRFAGVEGE
jgi:DNA-binding HxlR family transcriptional regulator